MYKRMTLGEVIAALKALPEGSKVVGISETIFSYRGYYERNAVESDTSELDAHELAAGYEKQLGKAITGWKGGDYHVMDDELFYVVTSPRDTGPCVIGFELNAETGAHQPQLLEQDYHF